MHKTWLITGGCGFIGRNLLLSLLKMDTARIRILDNLSTGTKEDLSQLCDFIEYQPKTDIPTPLDGEIQLVIGDIADARTAYSCAKDMDIIVHLAANTGVPKSVEDPGADFHSNAYGTFLMLDAARKAKARRFIFASSGAPTGECVPPVTEEVVPHPISPYGASKLAGEGYCSAYYRSYGLETIVLRFSNVYGFLSNHKTSVVAKLIVEAICGQTWKIYGDGSQTRDFIYIDDLVNAVINAAETPGIGGDIFQIATGQETSITELTVILKKLLSEKKIEIPSLYHENCRSGDILRNFADNTKAKLKLKWNANVSLSEGLSKTVDWFYEQAESIRLNHSYYLSTPKY